MYALHFFSACVCWGCTRSCVCTCSSVCVNECVHVCVYACVQAWICVHGRVYLCVSAFVPVCVPVCRECVGMNMCVGVTCVWACVCLCAYVCVHGHVCACGFTGLFHSQSIMWLSGPPACSSLEVNNDLDPSFQTNQAVLAAPAFKKRCRHFCSLSC